MHYILSVKVGLYYKPGMSYILGALSRIQEKVLAFYRLNNLE